MIKRCRDTATLWRGWTEDKAPCTVVRVCLLSVLSLPLSSFFSWTGSRLLRSDLFVSTTGAGRPLLQLLAILASLSGTVSCFELFSFRFSPSFSPAHFFLFFSTSPSKNLTNMSALQAQSVLVYQGGQASSLAVRTKPPMLFRFWHLEC